MRLDEETRAAAARYSAARLSKSTLRAYRNDWRVWERWCSVRGLAPIPAQAEHVALYITDLADGTVQAGRAHQWGEPRAASTVGRHLAAIACVHRLQGHASPCRHDDVLGIMEGVRRTKGTRPDAKAAAVLNIVRQMVAALPPDGVLRAVRDRAIILLGFWTACRRSEIAALVLHDVRVSDDAVRVLIRRSKTDQEGAGRWVVAPSAGDVALCPVDAMRSWLGVRGAVGGALFTSLAPGARGEPISGEVVSSAVKRAIEAAGLDPEDFGGHSLRSGFVTSAGQAGVPLAKIAQKTGHRRLDTLKAYLHEVEGVENDAGFGLA